MRERYIFVGDVHAADNPPRFCTEAYLTDMWKVLDELVPKAATETDAEAVVFVGDLFHHKAPSRTSHGLVAKLMRVFTNYPCPVYVVPGNHDIQHDRLTSLPQSPLGVLEKAGAIQFLWPAAPNGPEHVCGLPWTSSELDEKAMQAIDDLAAPVVVAHAPLYPPGKELRFEYWDIELFVSLLPEQVTHVYYGHVHDMHGAWSYDAPDGRRIWFANHGAVTRGSISESDLRRPLGCTLWDVEEGFRFLDFTTELTPVEDLFRLEDAAEEKESKAGAQSWIDAVQSIHTAANSMGELLRAVRAQRGQAGEDVVRRAEELVSEVDQGE
jgi:DNA repair exonuclease SbcCD nuclease subunit